MVNSIRDKLQVAALQKVEIDLTFPATYNAIFYCKTRDITLCNMSCNLQYKPLCCMLQEKNLEILG